MNTRKASNISLLLFSLVCFSLKLGANAFNPVCMNKFLELPCPVKHPSGEHKWRFKEHLDWHVIGFFSENKTYLSRNIPGKFKDVTNIFVNGTLTISSFTQELSGIYDCQSYNDGQVQHSMVDVVAVNCEKKVCEGDDAIVECDLLKYKNVLARLNKPTEIVWKKGKTKLVAMGPDMNVSCQNFSFPNIGAIQEIGALRIGSASKDIDGQRYTCVVHGEEGVTPRRYSVVINVQKCQKKINEACEGESIDLECPYFPPLATNTNDTRLEWFNGSTMIASMLHNQVHTTSLESPLVKVNETNGMITLVSLGVSDKGQYKCKVFRETVLLAEHNVTLNVTQCLGLTGNHNPMKEVQATHFNEETKDEDRNENALPYGLLILFVVPVCLCYMVIKQRPNYYQHPPHFEV